MGGAVFSGGFPALLLYYTQKYTKVFLETYTKYSRKKAAVTTDCWLKESSDCGWWTNTNKRFFFKNSLDGVVRFLINSFFYRKYWKMTTYHLSVKPLLMPNLKKIGEQLCVAYALERGDNQRWWWLKTCHTSI